MELRLEIKLASVEELATVAKALTGLQVGEAKLATAPTEPEQNPESEEMIEVESPYTAHPSEVKEAPAKKPAPAKETAAQAKLAKKAQEEAERAERVARLKAQMETNKNVAGEALAKRAETAIAQDNTQAVEPIEAIAGEIKQLGDTLMGFTGVDLEAKQKLTAQVMAKVGVPQGVRPTQLQQPMLGQFRDAYKAMVNSVVNPVMGGLV